MASARLSTTAWLLGGACVCLAGLAVVTPWYVAFFLSSGAALCGLGVARVLYGASAERVEARWADQGELGQMRREYMREVQQLRTEHQEDVDRLLRAYEEQAAILNRIGLDLAALRAKMDEDTAEGGENEP